MKLTLTSILGILGILGVAIAITACSPSAGTSISVEAEASQAIYNTMGLGAGTTSPVEYRVNVTIRNNGSTALTWDQILADFYPENGRHLKQYTFAYDPNKGGDRSAYLQGGNKPTELKPGASHDFEIGTNGYTFDLLAEADDKPLRFSIAILLNAKVIAGPYVAILPPLSELPSYEQKQLGQAGKVMKLSFSK